MAGHLDEKQCFHAENDSDKEKFYALVEFPYPSGQGLHVGHPRSYTALDIVARKKRMQGYNVLYPMGWDAFGLPTENFAIKNHVHPAEVTKKNIARFKSQLKSLGLSFDWSREINTTDPSYYKWTQWIFLQLFKKGLAYKKEMSVTGVPPASAFWRTRRLSTAFVSAAAARSFTRPRASGCSPSPSTHSA